jgi:hypothetical protein
VRPPAAIAAAVFTLALAPPALDPATIPIERLTRISGDVSGVRVPELAPRCDSGEDPVTHIRCTGEKGAVPHGLRAGAIFTPSITVYTPPQRQSIYDAYTRGPGPAGRPRGYTHMAVHLECRPGERGYHALFPPYPCDGAFLNGILREMYDHAPPIIPICFVMSDDSQAVTLPDGFDRGLCRLVVPKWEFPVADCDLKAVRAAFPDALLYWENPAGQIAPKPDRCSPQPFPEGRAWFQHAKRAYNLRGILIETDVRALGPDPADAARAIESAHDAWQDVDAVLFETDIYQKFWDGRSEADGVAYNDAILTSVPWLKGFVSGGTRFARN